MSVVALLGAFAVYVPAFSAARPAVDSLPAAGQSEPFAIWPETDPSVVPPTLPAWRTSAVKTVRHFSRAVLRFPDPVVRKTAGGFRFQPGDRGFDVSRTARSHRIEVRVNRVVDASHWSVDDVWGFGRHDHSATVQIGKRHGYVGFGPSPSTSRST